MTEENNNLPESAAEPKGFSLTPTLTSLFKPTTDYLGTEIRDYVKAKVEELKARKREKNVSQHMESVGVTLGMPLSYDQESLEHISQLDLFDEWIEGAQDIDPSEPVLARLWQGLLLEIVQGKAHDRTIVSTLKQLSASDAELLLWFKRSARYRVKGMEGKFIINKLRGLNIVEQDWFQVVVFGAAYLAFVTALFSIPDVFPFSNLFDGASRILLIPVAVAPLIVFAPLISRYRLTWLGQKLLSYVSFEDATAATEHNNPLKNDAEERAF